MHSHITRTTAQLVFDARASTRSTTTPGELSARRGTDQDVSAKGQPAAVLGGASVRRLQHDEALLVGKSHHSSFAKQCLAHGYRRTGRNSSILPTIRCAIHGGTGADR